MRLLKSLFIANAWAGGGDIPQQIAINIPPQQEPESFSLRIIGGVIVGVLCGLILYFIKKKY